MHTESSNVTSLQELEIDHSRLQRRIGALIEQNTSKAKELESLRKQFSDLTLEAENASLRAQIRAFHQGGLKVIQHSPDCPGFLLHLVSF